MAEALWPWCHKGNWDICVALVPILLTPGPVSVLLLPEGPDVELLAPPQTHICPCAAMFLTVIDNNELNV